jgi:hypothetical protein
MKTHNSRILGIATLTSAVLAFCAAEANAYTFYSDNKGAVGQCASCHGAFAVAPYDGPLGADPGVWPDGLHVTHRGDMLNGDCDTCHGGVGTSGRQVRLNSSAGGTGLDPIACLGCHGRAEPEAGDAVTGAGLRQHHTNSGVGLCVGCHADADPASFLPAGEDILPPYYFIPDGAHPLKPNDPCNLGGVGEDYAGDPVGLDNDGDNAYDMLDPDCAPVTDCSDELDNDGDGLTDLDDPGCADASDLSERAPHFACDDGADNDSDGRSDFDPVTFANPGDKDTPPAGQGDPGCRKVDARREAPQCQDGIDNDGDGRTDYDAGVLANGTADPDGADPHCSQPWRACETASCGGGRRCGLGFELGLLALPILWTRRRRSRAKV